MAGNITFAMLKPDTSAANNVGKILALIEENGFEVVAIKKMQLHPTDIPKFYGDHVGRSYFEDLKEFMTSGPVFPMVLKKNNAVEDFRKILGSTNPATAAEGTIRKLYASALERNACHGSDSDANALIEMGCFFSKLEILD